MTYRILTQLLEMTSFTAKKHAGHLANVLLKKICFTFWSRNFQCGTPDVYLKFVFSVLNVVTVSYLLSLLFKGAASCEDCRMSVMNEWVWSIGEMVLTGEN